MFCFQHSAAARHRLCLMRIMSSVLFCTHITPAEDIPSVLLNVSNHFNFINIFLVSTFPPSKLGPI